MNPRTISVGLRFRVLERDDFSCRYCGSRPPWVRLVVDHAIPVAGGGTNDFENLVTACEPCNQGKAARPLAGPTTVERLVRPDGTITRVELATLQGQLLVLTAVDSGAPGGGCDVALSGRLDGPHERVARHVWHVDLDPARELDWARWVKP